MLKSCWWFRNPAKQLRLAVYHIICKGFIHPRWWSPDVFQQQSSVFLLDFFRHASNNHHLNSPIRLLVEEPCLTRKPKLGTSFFKLKDLPFNKDTNHVNTTSPLHPPWEISIYFDLQRDILNLLKVHHCLELFKNGINEWKPWNVMARYSVVDERWWTINGAIFHRWDIPLWCRVSTICHHFSTTAW